MNKAEKIQQKYFIPDERLVKWVSKRLELEREKSEVKKRRTGGKMSARWTSEKKTSAARKSEILDDIIFHSMANLIYFFEALSMNKNLNDLFEKDVIDLLDPRFVADAAERELLDPGTGSHYFRDANLVRFINGVLSISKGFEKESHDVLTHPRPLIDFRIALLYQLGLIISETVGGIFRREYGDHSQVTKSARDDFNKVLGWLALIAIPASKIKINSERVIGFSPIDFEMRRS